MGADVDAGMEEAVSLYQFITDAGVVYIYPEAVDAVGEARSGWKGAEGPRYRDVHLRGGQILTIEDTSGAMALLLSRGGKTAA